MNRRQALLTALGVGVTVVAGCLSLDDDNADEPVTISSHDLVRRDVGTEEETVTIEGTVEIHADGLQLIEITVEFFDDEGESLGPHTDVIDDFSPGTQAFAVQYPNQGEAAATVANYDITVTTAV